MRKRGCGCLVGLHVNDHALYVCGCCGVGVLCENCIVDASIFLLSMLHCFGGVWVEFLCFAIFCVCKIVCKCFVYLRMLSAALCGRWCVLYVLGNVFGYSGRTVDALACLADEGRVRLRYASGSCQQSVDPRMSEWGNPAPVVWCYPQMNA